MLINEFVLSNAYYQQLFLLHGNIATLSNMDSTTEVTMIRKHVTVFVERLKFRIQAIKVVNQYHTKQRRIPDFGVSTVILTLS